VGKTLPAHFLSEIRICYVKIGIKAVLKALCGTHLSWSKIASFFWNFDS